MAKVTRVTLTNLDNPSTAVSQINANFAALQTAMDNTVSRDGTSPNSMVASLDMNGNAIINLSTLITSLPTVDPEVSGQLWSDGGTVKVSAG
jgi:hypothetical protein